MKSEFHLLPPNFTLMTLFDKIFSHLPHLVNCVLHFTPFKLQLIISSRIRVNLTSWLARSMTTTRAWAAQSASTLTLRTYVSSIHRLGNVWRVCERHPTIWNEIGLPCSDARVRDYVEHHLLRRRRVQPCQPAPHGAPRWDTWGT
jgi:hypothetical protein